MHNTLVGSKITVETDTETQNGAITSLKYNQTEFLVTEDPAYNARITAFLQGEELSQTGVMISATIIGTTQVKVGHPKVRPPAESEPVGTIAPAPIQTALQAIKKPTYLDITVDLITPPTIAQFKPKVRNRITLDFLGHPNILRYEYALEIAASTSGTNTQNQYADDILGAEGAQETPHFSLASPTLYIQPDLSQQAYVLNVFNRAKLVRHYDQEPHPRDGGVVLGSANGLYCIGIYQFRPQITNQVVRWRRGTDVNGVSWSELSPMEIALEGTPITKGKKSRDVYIVMGTADEVQKSFIDLHNLHTLLRKKQDYIRAKSPITQENLVL